MNPDQVIKLIRKLPDTVKTSLVDDAGLYVVGTLDSTLITAYQCGDISEDMIIRETVLAA